MTPYRICVQIALSQHGLITRRQALDAGLREGAIGRLLSGGRWRVLIRGVYVVGAAPPSYHQSLLGYILAAEPALATHRAAAFLYGLRGCDEPILEITSAGREDFKGVTVHRDLRITDVRHRVISGIPTTPIERTVLNLAAVLKERRFEYVLDDVLARRLSTVDRLAAELEARAVQGRNGIRLFRTKLEQRSRRSGHSESVKETDADTIFDMTGLRDPDRQYRILRPDGSLVHRADFAYPEAILLIEMQSVRWHSGVLDLSKDSRQYNELLLMGYRILQYTEADMKERPREMAAEIRRAYELGIREARRRS